MKVLIVDDEPAARLKIRHYLAGLQPDFSILEAADGPSAVHLLKTEGAGLVFLDIQMPGMSGFQVIEAIGPERMPPVVFVTAYDQYAISAFEVQAVDYLLKPFDEDRFRKAMQRALDMAAHRQNYSGMLEMISRRPMHLERILVNIGERHFLVSCTDIIYLSSDDKYVEVHTASKKYLLRDSLANLEDQLDPARFTRIHRSTIVNLDWVQEITPRSHGDYTVLMLNGEKLLLSRRFRDRIF